MAADDYTPETAAAVPVENTAAPLDKTITKPEGVHEKRPVSGSSHDSEDVDLEKQQAQDDMETAAPVKSEAESVYPPAKQTAAVMLSICLTIFLVALVG